MTIPARVAAGGPGSAAVAAGSEAATAAAAAAVARGGNAVDAVVASGFAAAVAEPGLTGLAGGGFLTVRVPDGTTSVLDFFACIPGLGEPSRPEPPLDEVEVQFPDATQVFHVGPGSVAVPGCLDGLIQAHARWGRLPLDEVVAPARVLAQEGFTLEPAQAGVMSLLRDIFALTVDSSSLFTDGGRAWSAGSRLRNAPLARFLARIAAGDVSSWSDAALADSLIGATAGAVTSADLADYRVVLRDPLLVGLPARLATNPAPSFGGSIVAESLVRVLAAGGVGAQLPATILGVAADVRARQDPGRASIRGTTHVSAVDADGMLASITTSNGSCSGVVVPELGVQLNNMMGEVDLRPGGAGAGIAGERLRSMMAPSMLAADDWVIALGSGGSERIRSAMAWVMLQLVQGQTLPEAVAAPRLHADDSGVLQVEPDAEPAVVSAASHALSTSGSAPIVNHWSRHDLYFGGVNAVQRWDDGSVLAVADTRRGGAIAVLSP